MTYISSRRNLRPNRWRLGCTEGAGAPATRPSGHWPRGGCPPVSRPQEDAVREARQLEVQEWTVDELRRLDRAGLMAVFRQLAAPRPEAMAGEYASSLPDYSNTEWRNAMAALGKDYWLGKSDSPRPFNGHRGHGLNSDRRARRGPIRRLSRFVWDIGPSVVDAGPSLVMRYAAFRNWGGSHDLIDEIRVATADAISACITPKCRSLASRHAKATAGRASSFSFFQGPSADCARRRGRGSGRSGDRVSLTPSTQHARMPLSRQGAEGSIMKAVPPGLLSAARVRSSVERADRRPFHSVRAAVGVCRRRAVRCRLAARQRSS